MTQAFILGAGLGTRLRPLTDHVPKPLVPLFHRPLAEWTMRACQDAGIRRFAINTHHLPGAWQSFPGATAATGADVTFFHEPILLDTGGGLRNIRPWVADEALLIHNGDIYSTLDLSKLIAAHRASGLPATLAMRSEGGEKRVALDDSLSRVIDVRHLLGRSPGTHVFSGIYCVNPDFFERLPSEEIVSVIPAFMDLAREGRLGAIVMDDGHWLDLGDRSSYLEAHRSLALEEAIHPKAVIGDGAIIEESVIGRGAVIEAGAVVKRSVVWEGRRVAAGACIEDCIVCSHDPVLGTHRSQDL